MGAVFGLAAAWLQRQWLWIAAGAAAIAAFLALLARERSIGRAQERARQRDQALENRRIRDEVERDNLARPGSAAERLRDSRWQRRG